MSILDFVQPVPPDVAIEIDSAHVAAARLVWRGPVSTVAGHVVEPLPPGVVAPALAAANITDVPTVARAISQALVRLGGRITRAALVIPDTAAKVSLIRFDTVPASSADLVELVRWQVRKSAPFPLDQAVISFTPGITPEEGGQEFVVTTARADVIEQYEQACVQARVHAGLIDIATFSILNGVLTAQAAPSGDWLLVHATPTYTTLAVLRGGDLIFFRNREEESERTLADVVHQTAMYYEDRLKGGGFSRVLLAGGAVQGVDAVQRSLEQRLGVRIEAVPQPDLASLVGILSRERKVA
ncbi:MAG TPA: pilus assembly protein PilM [Vicinamibacterales bacterium]|nr:pilus assembly protein PilM [Vicinamibacterales bacterium]